MLTALRISSTDISTNTPLRRASTPYTPVQNRKAARKRNSFRYTAPSVPSRDHEVQGSVHHVGGGHDPDGRDHHGEGDGREGNLEGDVHKRLLLLRRRADF